MNKYAISYRRYDSNKSVYTACVWYTVYTINGKLNLVYFVNDVEYIAEDIVEFHIITRDE